MSTETPSVGDKAPDFYLLNQDEKESWLNKYQGKNVILYFYQKDNTPGCSLEDMTFTQYKDEFEQHNTTILWISKDSCQSHQWFIEKKRYSHQPHFRSWKEDF